MRQRLQKIIARAGLSSRRSAEDLIREGRVRLNGKIVTELGSQADPFADKVEVDGKRLVARDLVYAILHKPKNVVSTLSDPEGRPTVSELLKPLGERVHPVGRLDYATSGVLLATNDGDFTNGLLHPKKDVPKTYVVKVQGRMEKADLDQWAKGVDLEDGRTLPARVHFLRHEEDKTWFEITIREGRNQQLRRMGEATRFFVMRLSRVSFAGITHDDLRPGEIRHLTKDELRKLKEEYGIPKRVPKTATSRPEVMGRVARRMRSVHRGGAAHEEEMDERPHRDPSAHEATADRPARAARFDESSTRPARPSRDAAAPRDERPRRSGPPRDAARPARPARSEERSDKPGKAPPKSARSDRSETTPRGAARRGPPARGRGGR